MTITTDYNNLALLIKQWGQELGFAQIGITDINVQAAGEKLELWLQQNYHGEMEYMRRHGSKRYQPQELIPGTMRVITARMDYLPEKTSLFKLLRHPRFAFISRYALGKDYHKLLRKRLSKLGERIRSEVGSIHYRVFCDSAPVMEKPLAAKSGLGWIGKHTNLIHPQAGSYFFLGSIYLGFTFTH